MEGSTSSRVAASAPRRKTLELAPLAANEPKGSYFARAKLISLFSLLFGIGFAIQIARLEERTGGYLRTYGRRLLVLYLIGLAHLGLTSDVLCQYAMCGASLLLLVGFS